MKQLFVLLMFSVLFSHVRVQAPKEISQVIKINPLGLLIGDYSFAYERVLSPKTSGQLEFAIISIVFGNVDTNGQVSISGYSIGPQYRYYVNYASKKIPQGFFVSPYTQFASAEIKVSQMDAQTKAIGSGRFNFSMFSLGTNLGKQWIIGDIVSIDFYLGIAYSFIQMSEASLKYSTISLPPKKIKIPNAFSKDGFLLNGGFTVGYAF